MIQIEKTEIIIGIIAVIKSQIIANLFLEKEKEKPNFVLIKKITKKINVLDDLLKSFYRNTNLSDEEYQNLINKIKKYGKIK